MTREEMIVKARTAKTPEELLQMAHEIGMSDFTEENARAYFDILQKSGENKIDGKKSGELADEELDVSAGGCGSPGRKQVSPVDGCAEGWRCAYCGKTIDLCECSRTKYLWCGCCKFASYEDGDWFCNRPEPTEPAAK